MADYIDNGRQAKGHLVSYELNVTEGRTWIHARVCAPVTKALFLDCLKAAVERAAKCGMGNFLIDARSAPSIKTTVEDFDIANYRLQELGFERSSKSAIVVDPEDKTHDFFETCTMNAGYNWRIFSTVDLATQWLDLMSLTP